jgi:hypothetical protein
MRRSSLILGKEALEKADEKIGRKMGRGNWVWREKGGGGGGELTSEREQTLIVA